MTSRRWRPNIGSKPERTRDEIAALEAAGAPDAAFRIEYVYVRLRNGIVPTEQWPVDTGRPQNTRWTLIGHPFDILHWIEA